MPDRDALDAALDVLIYKVRDQERCVHPQVFPSDILAALAAVRRLAEQGEVYEVKEMSTLNRYGDWTSRGIELSDEYAPGDRVRVTRIEEAP